MLEQNQLTSGSTWHAAGLVGQLRSSASITQLLRYSVALYDAARGRDRPRDRLEDDGLPAPGDQRRAHDRIPTPRHHGAQLRHGDASDLARRGQGDVAADGRLRSRRRELPADRRAGEPVRHHPVARQGRAHARARASSRACASPASASSAAASCASRPTRGRSPARRSSIAAGNGRARSARSPASACRCSR